MLSDKLDKLGFPCDGDDLRGHYKSMSEEEVKALHSKMTVVPTKGDGSCFYQALAIGIWRGRPPPGAAGYVRREIGETLCDRAKGTLRDPAHKEFLADHDEHAYCRGLLTRKGEVTQGDHVIIEAAAKVFGVNIVIFIPPPADSRDKKWHVTRVEPDATSDPKKKRMCVYLLLHQGSSETGSHHDDNGHYEALIPESHTSKKSSDDVIKPGAYYWVNLDGLAALVNSKSKQPASRVRVAIKGSDLSKLRSA